MQRVSTFLMFSGDMCGKAKEAIDLYTSLIAGSEIKSIEYFEADEGGGNEGDVKHAVFTLGGQEYLAFDSAMGHKFSFTPSISIYVSCETEEELDRLFKGLSQDGAIMMPPDNYGFSRKFTWIADKYGVSWQLNLA
ncbi:VOC family protein [Desertivirga brevis]|uniref:VOC family protein n=1 Tax=Desertivirga brevis TaxID=2810310 RepID=UPI001A971478|nr:VOC family protein [Pedobacter sp. SYSU D00873]